MTEPTTSNIVTANPRDAVIKTSAAAMVRDGLRLAILRGEYVSGTQLRQDELAERFGTSRIPVREALRQLEAEGLVTIQANRGATVTAFSLDEIIELLEIRIALECRALRLAIPNMVDADFAIAGRHLEDYEAEADPINWGGLNWKFHSAIYSPCGKGRLLAMIEANYGNVDRFTRLNVSMSVGKEKPLREHWDLLRLCKAGAAADATQLLEEHIKHTQKSILADARHRHAAAGTPSENGRHRRIG